MNVAIFLSGILFLFIIITVFARGRFGYDTFSDLDSDTKLQKIDNDPKKFQIGVALAIIEHGAIIGLAVTLFFAFYSYSLILAVVWVIFRIGEALIQIYNKKNYWRLLDVAKQYTGSSGAEKNELSDLGRTILQSKNSSFVIAQICFSIGTLAYSILFTTLGVVLPIIGWFGIVASILYGLGNGIYLVKPDFKVLWNIGGLLIFLFESVLAVWLIYSSLIIL